MDDLISRQAAIEALDKRFDSIPMEQTSEILMLRKDLRELPHAQLGANLAEVGTDCISRQAAIDALKNDMASLDHIIKGMSTNDVRLDAYVSQRNQVNYDIYTINSLPPAQPEPHWTPCNKELPTKSDTYLVSANDKSVFNLYFSTEHGWDGWWNGRISAWMPRPEPYEESEAAE